MSHLRPASAHRWLQVALQVVSQAVARGGGAKPKEEQRPVPPEPPLPGGQELTDLTDDADLQEFNAQAMIIWKEKAPSAARMRRRSSTPKRSSCTGGCQAVPDGYAYPTVLTAVRSVRRGRAPVRVSEAGPVRLDQRRVEARRVVRGAWEASDAFPLAEAKAAAAAERDDRAVRRHAPRANHRARTDDFVPSATVRRTFSETAFKLAETERGRVSRHELHAVLERHPHLSDVLGLPRAADAASLALALAPLSADAAARIVQQSAFEKLVACDLAEPRGRQERGVQDSLQSRRPRKPERHRDRERAARRGARSPRAVRAAGGRARGARQSLQPHRHGARRPRELSRVRGLCPGGAWGRSLGSRGRRRAAAARGNVDEQVSEQARVADGARSCSGARENGTVE